MIYILDEAKNAECAREMFVSGDYIVPTFNGQLRTDKPPLHYFFMVTAYKIFGVSAFSARFFSAVFGALTILITFLFTNKYLSEKKAWTAALILISSIHYNFQMRLSVPDPYLIFFMTASFMSFFLFINERKKLWLWIMYAAFGLGLLTKGPVALGLPGLIMLIFLIVSKRLTWATIRSFNIPIGVIIVLAIALPWYWMNYVATNGVWTEGFFLKHNLKRFSDTMEGHGGFFLLPLLMVIAGLLPLGIFSMQALVANFKRSRHEVVLFAQVIVIVIVLFFSFSQTKLPNYTTPAYPFLAISISWLLSKVVNQTASRKGISWALWAYLVIAFAIPVAVYLFLKNDPVLTGMEWVWSCFVLMPMGAIAAIFFFLKSNRLSMVLASLGITVIITNGLLFGVAYPEVYRHNPVASSLDQVKQYEEVVYYKMMNSAYVFNMQRIIPMIADQASLKAYLKDHPGAAVISRKQYEDEIRAANPALTPVFEQRDTFEKPVTVVYGLGNFSSPQ